MVRLLGDLALDCAAITCLVTMYALRHRSKDLVLAYAALNIGVFAVVAMLATQRVELAVGFGLFGILSIVRLRSSAITQEEVAYYFVALTLGLVNGLHPPFPGVLFALNGALLGAVFVAGHRWVLPRSRRQTVTLDVVHPCEAALYADLERRLGGRVRHAQVSSVDFVRELTVVDVRFDAPKSSPSELPEHTALGQASQLQP